MRILSPKQLMSEVDRQQQQIKDDNNRKIIENSDLVLLRIQSEIENMMKTKEQTFIEIFQLHSEEHPMFSVSLSDVSDYIIAYIIKVFKVAGYKCSQFGNSITISWE